MTIYHKEKPSREIRLDAYLNDIPKVANVLLLCVQYFRAEQSVTTVTTQSSVGVYLPLLHLLGKIVCSLHLVGS